MILDANYKKGWAFEPFGNTTQIPVQGVATDFIPQERAAFFGGENQMNVNSRERLRHDERMTNRAGFAHRKRQAQPGFGLLISCIGQPRVARASQPCALVMALIRPK